MHIDLQNTDNCAAIYTNNFNSSKHTKLLLKDCMQILNYNNFILSKIYIDNLFDKNISIYSRIQFINLIADAKLGEFNILIVPSIYELVENYAEYLDLKILLKNFNLKLIVANLAF